MSTREQITQLADTLMRDKGYNAFSFYDISKAIGIKTASIHYHFPAKSVLAVAVIEQHIEALNAHIQSDIGKSPIEHLDKFFSLYTTSQIESNVCIICSLSTDFNTLDIQVQSKVKILLETLLTWVSEFLKEGRNLNMFHFEGTPRTKALMIVTNLLAGTQLSRITGDKDFNVLKDAVKRELLTK